MNILLKNILFISIIAVPLSSIIPIPGTIIWYPQFICLMLIGFFVLSLGLWRLNKFLAIFTAFLALSYVFVCNQHPRALLCLIIAYLGSYITCGIANLKNIENVYKLITVFAFIQFCFVIIQAVGHDPIFNTISSIPQREIVGFCGSYNQLGAYSAIVTPILYSINPFLSLLTIIPAVLSKTSTALVAIVISLLAYMFFIKQYVRMAILGIVIIISATVWTRFDTGYLSSFQERFNVWKLTVSQLVSGKVVQTNNNVNNLIKTNPLFGFGIGSFMVISPSSQGDIIKARHRYEHAHNDLIEALFEYGYIGIILLLLLISSIIYRFDITTKTNSLIAVFCSLIAASIVSMGVYVIHAPVSFYMTMLVLGIFYWEVKNASKSV